MATTREEMVKQNPRLCEKRPYSKPAITVMSVAEWHTRSALVTASGKKRCSVPADAPAEPPVYGDDDAQFSV